MGDLQIEKGIFRLNGEFANRKRDFLVKCGICKEKMCDFRLNGGFAKRKRDFRINGGFVKTKRVIFGVNEGFSKRKRVIFA